MRKRTELRVPARKERTPCPVCGARVPLHRREWAPGAPAQCMRCNLRAIFAENAARNAADPSDCPGCGRDSCPGPPECNPTRKEAC